MCTTCGCGSGETKIEGEAHGHEHQHADGAVHRHAHDHDHDHDHGHDHDGHGHDHADDHGHDHAHGPGCGHDHVHHDGHAHAPGLSPSRMVQIEQDILAKNDQHARFNREFLAERGIFAVNLVSSPGSGKTTLLTESIKRLLPSVPVTVIEGDQQTTNDAERIRAGDSPGACAWPSWWT